LVVAGRGDHHLAALQRRVVQRGDLARVGEQPLRPRDHLHLDGLGALVDQEHLVPVLQQFLGDGAAHRARSRDRDPHQASSSSGAATAALILARSSALAITCTMSPSWITVSRSGTSASPIRDRNATRVRACSSSLPTFSPTHRYPVSSSTRTTAPVGSRHSGSAPSGSSRRRIWSAV